MVNVTMPLGSVDVIAFVALQEVLLSVSVAGAPPLMVTVGVSIGSEEVKLSVMVLPGIAKDRSELLDAMVTCVSVGVAGTGVGGTGVGVVGTGVGVVGTGVVGWSCGYWSWGYWNNWFSWNNIR